MEIGLGETAVIGDDILTDVLGAQKRGMKWILVKTASTKRSGKRIRRLLIWFLNR
jgi:predicted HAD superfamily phosphohydrolase YqeG